MDKAQKGRLAEEAAAAYLAGQGYTIREKNYRIKSGEIDLIAEDHGTLVFIEVRSRGRTDYGLPQETVDYRKQQKIKKTAAYYLKSKGLWERACRFDVAAVLFTAKEETLSLDYIKDAF